MLVGAGPELGGAGFVWTLHMAGLVEVVLPSQATLPGAGACAPGCPPAGPPPKPLAKGLVQPSDFQASAGRKADLEEVPASGQSGGHWVLRPSLQSKLLER